MVMPTLSLFYVPAGCGKTGGGSRSDFSDQPSTRQRVF